MIYLIVSVKIPGFCIPFVVQERDITPVDGIWPHLLQRENLINRANRLCQYASIETEEEKNYLRENRNSILRTDLDFDTRYLLREAFNVRFGGGGVNKAEGKQL